MSRLPSVSVLPESWKTGSAVIQEEEYTTGTNNDLLHCLTIGYTAAGNHKETQLCLCFFTQTQSKQSSHCIFLH